MLKLEQVVFGNMNSNNTTRFTLTMYDEIHLKYCVTIVVQGITINTQRWYIRSDNLRELYHEAMRIAKVFKKQDAVDVVVLMFAVKLETLNGWWYYRPLALYK